MSKGFSLNYAPEAIVYHPARNFIRVLRKSRLYGTGLLLTIKQRRWRFCRTLYLMIRLLIPVPNRIILKYLLGVKKRPEVEGRRLAIWGISYLSQICLLCGVVDSLFKKNSD